MADTKVSALTALTGANVVATEDVLAIVDTSVTATKKILVSEIAQALLVSGTEQATTSGTSIDFTSIPAWVKRITVQLVGVSTNGTSPLLIQIGDSGGIEATGYLGTSHSFSSGGVGGANFTTGFGIRAGLLATTVRHGAIVLTLEDSAAFTWVASGNVGCSDDTTASMTAGSKALSAALDRVRLTTVNGTDEFDAGGVNILYE